MTERTDITGAPIGSCNCHHYGSAAHCPVHTQADFDSATPADETAAVETLAAIIVAHEWAGYVGREDERGSGCRGCDWFAETRIDGFTMHASHVAELLAEHTRQAVDAALAAVQRKILARRTWAERADWPVIDRHLSILREARARGGA